MNRLDELRTIAEKKICACDVCVEFRELLIEALDRAEYYRKELRLAKYNMNVLRDSLKEAREHLDLHCGGECG